MILTDTSVWIDHLRVAEPELQRLLEQGEVATHPFIIGELSMGSIRNRTQVLSDLSRLPRIASATSEEVQYFVTHQELFGLGIGFIDAHLLAAAQMTAGSLLWTRDKRLHQIAARFGIAFHPRVN